MPKIRDKQFVYHIWWTSWRHLSLGFHIDLQSPNIEIHLPFCFLKIGWTGIYHYSKKEKMYRHVGKIYNYHEHEHELN